MYKIQPYFSSKDAVYEDYHLVDCDDGYRIVPEVDGFLQFNKIRNYSPFTIQAYAYDLQHYYNFCRACNVDPLRLGDGKQVMDTFMKFVTYLLSHKDVRNKKMVSFDKPVRADSTINRIMATVYNFYRYLSMNNLCKMPPIFTSYASKQRTFISELTRAHIRNYSMFRRKTSQRSIKYVTREQYNALLGACRSLRDKIIVALLFEAGMRSGEVCGIHFDDLMDIDHGILKIVPRDNNPNKARVKNHAAGSILLPGYIVDMLTKYITETSSGSCFLFTITKGPNRDCPITRRTIASLFKDLSRRTGIKVHAHMLRHGFAVEKLDDNWELFEIQSYLRHRDPTATAVYAEFTDKTKAKRMQDFFEKNKIDEGEYSYVIDD